MSNFVSIYIVCHYSCLPEISVLIYPEITSGSINTVNCIGFKIVFVVLFSSS